MKKSLTFKETVILTLTLFGMFFGAGNLIFPAMLGVNAGSNTWVSFLGVFITAVGLPMLAVVALGMSKSNGVLALSSKVSRRYGLFFSTLLYLTIGPLFAIPRCASTSFSVGAVNLIPEGNENVALAIFSFAFFAIVLLFSLKPTGIMTWIGKILTPVFLICLAVLVVAAFINPVQTVENAVPTASYVDGGSAFFNGFLEGYNTLDALAGLAFGIVVVNVVRKHGIEDPGRVAVSTAKAGVFSCLFMGVIYLCITLVSAQSASICGGVDNGGAVLGVISNHYFGNIGAVLMTAIVTFACLKTAIGLVISCSEAFVDMFPKGPSYRVWAITFCLVSFGIANFGLTTIVAYCVPVLMFLYPLSITLILLALSGKLFNNSRTVYVWTTAFTLVAAMVDFIAAFASTADIAWMADFASAIGNILPLYSLGLGWVCPAVTGFVIGIIIYKVKGKKQIAQA